jgi:ribosome recycling factor
MTPDFKKSASEKMELSLEHLKHEFGGIRTGRASLTLLEGIHVEYFGTKTPINQVASLSVPESRLILIQPWDLKVIPEIEKAIRASDLGLNPANDGKVIRLAIPPLTEERRKELVKLIKKMGEDAKIAIRNIRRDTNDEIKKQHKISAITEDAQRKIQDDIQKVTDQFISRIDEAVKKKEAEVMEV